ncbi:MULTISPECIES: DUF7146 domain-containing protein [Bradyrhizobium]|uniref:DUF7146 domain-containing protein n=1 Tax=Bradyrhizobium TaxID=374 RepID=UPI001EDBEFCA|nr:toprim domain-containing protein [Bradyrhizobium zhengyangense]MCG2644291.1 toprim domain-containing protein [Bradyrhizobium zhengyangense]
MALSNRPSAEEIALALGGRKYGNQWLACCPAHEDRSPSLSLTDTQDGLVLWHCLAGCSQADVRDALVARGLWHRAADAGRAVRWPYARRAPMPTSSIQNERAARLWGQAVDPRGTLAERYLLGRGLRLDDHLAMRVLRFHASCPFGNDRDGRTLLVPALIAAFRGFDDHEESGPPQAIHRIGLNSDGSKIAKLMLGRVGGAAIKIDADDMVEAGLGVCEGLETGIGVRATGWGPIWALGSAGAIRAFEPIPGIEALTIFADHDGTGLDAARACARRWADAGREVEVHLRSAPGKDFADE